MLGLRLDVRQSQGLVLTPQLQQAIKLLQLSNQDLASFVDRELAENPFLTRSADEAAIAPPAPAPAAERERELDGWVGLSPSRHDRDDAGWSAQAGNAATDQRLRLVRAAPGQGEGEPADYEGRLGRPQTLTEQLRAQLCTSGAPAAVLDLARILVDCLDDDGYLREPDRALAAQFQQAEEVVRDARRAIQACEPCGIGARDLPECLALQLADRNRLDPAMRALLAHLPLVAKADLAALQRHCRVDLEDLREMIAELRQLDPRPARGLAPTEPIDAVPDLVVFGDPARGWHVELNEGTLPRVGVDRTLYRRITGQAGDRREREFMSERYQAAGWLAKALDQRARTLLRVGQAIVDRQAGFLLAGPARLRPLVLRDIAVATGLHESTVSRAAADKFVATPRGTFPLRYFFTTAINATEGDERHSAEAIRQDIRRMIDAEPHDEALSDDQIVVALKDRGVAIARRTVAKYRESLGIASSVQRRRSKVLGA